MSGVQKRATAFAHLDHAKLGWFHLRACLVAGVGFFADAYDIFIIGLALPMVYAVYFPGQKMNPWIDATMKASTSYGNFVGQIAFGYLGDKLGRKRMYGVELIILIVATIGSCFSASLKRGADILVILGLWRFVLGIGIGGDYPASAIITSEFANIKHRGKMIAGVFSMQGMGILIGGLVTLATVAAFKSAIIADVFMLDYVWRIMIGFGIIPAVVAVYFRLTIPETPRYTVDVVGDNFQAESDIMKVLELNGDSGKATEITSTQHHAAVVQEQKESFGTYFSRWENLRVLIGTMYCWFALDIAWYGLSLNQGVVLGLINYGGAGAANKFEENYQKAIGNLIVACLGTVPGYFFSVGLIDKFGRKPIQFAGFGVITVILVVLAATWTTIKKNTPAFLVLYTIAQFFFNFGPNTTTFVVPAEVFPTQYRSTAHGLSAAAGKLGAIVGTQIIAPYFQVDSTVQIVLGVFAAVMATGFLATFLIPEPKGKSLEELAGNSYEDEVPAQGEYRA